MPTQPRIPVIEDSSGWFVVERGKPDGTTFASQNQALRAAGDRAGAIGGRVGIRSRFGHYVETATVQFAPIDEETD